MKIGILAAGRVGSTLGRVWVNTGHEVRFGVRDPAAAKIAHLVEELGATASAGTVAEAAAFGEVVVVATPWSATKSALKQAGDLAGKVVLDCTNPLQDDLDTLDVPTSTSGGEQVAKWARGARVVKIFNTTSSTNMADPNYGDVRVTMLYAGDDPEAKAVAADLARDVGFEPVDFGPLRGARLLEELALAWITLAYPRGLGPDFALQVLRRPS